VVHIMLPAPDHLYIHLVSHRYFFHTFPKYLCFDTACGSKKNIGIKLFECVSSEYLLFHAMWTIFQLCHDEKKFLLLRDMVVSCFLLDQYLIHWNSNSHVDIPSHSDTLFWFRVSQHLSLHLIGAYLMEIQHIPAL
jgi:hypothetical protein